MLQSNKEIDTMELIPKMKKKNKKNYFQLRQ